MQKEYASLLDKQTWEPAELPRGQRAIGVRWVLKLKKLPDGRLDKYKARLVVKGYSQREDIDYDHLFAPVAKRSSLLYLLHITAIEDLDCHCVDISTAFLNGGVDEELYIQQPDQFNDGTGRVLRLKKALYGLKQAPRQWYKELSGTLEALHYEFCVVDKALAKKNIGGHTVYTIFYVDDFLFASQSRAALEQAKKEVLDKYAGTDKGEILDYLGMRIIRDRAARTLSLDQSGYIRRLLIEAQMNDCIGKYIPMPMGCASAPVGQQLPAAAAARYRALVGSLMYLSTSSRADMAFATGYLARYLSAPSELHMQLLNHLCRYLKATRHKKMTLGGTRSALNLEGWVDSDFANEAERRRSTYGYVFKAGNSVISWKSKRNSTVTKWKLSCLEQARQ